MKIKLIEVIAPEILLSQKSRNTLIPIESYHRLFLQENRGCLLLKYVGQVNFSGDHFVRGYKNLLLSSNKQDDSFLKSKVSSIELVEDRVVQIELIKSINKKYKDQIHLFRKNRRKTDDWVKYYRSSLASFFLSIFSIQTIDFIIQEFSTAPAWAIGFLIALTTASLFSLVILIWSIVKLSRQRKREEIASDETEEFLDRVFTEDIMSAHKYQLFFIRWINGDMTYHFVLPGTLFRKYIRKISSSTNRVVKYISTKNDCFMGYPENHWKEKGI